MREARLYDRSVIANAGLHVRRDAIVACLTRLVGLRIGRAPQAGTANQKEALREQRDVWGGFRFGVKRMRGLALCCAVALGLMLLALSRGAAADDTPAERLPVPKSAAQTPIANSIRAQYREDYASRDAAVQLALAQKFQGQVAELGADPTRQYVLLREARELATNAGNFDAAFSIIDGTARLFTVDADELKVTALSNAMDRSLISKPQLLENYLKAGDAALDRGNVQLAYQATVLSREITRAAHDPALTQQARAFEMRVHDARRTYEAVLAAAKKLNANPDDAQSALLVGRYFCFMQQRWDDGLVLLARGSDAHLKELAQKDLDGPPSPEAMADLADAYWDLPDTKQTPQRASRERAVHWYEHALPSLTGERKTRAQERIANH